jgi:hypothetical protein
MATLFQSDLIREAQRDAAHFERQVRQDLLARSGAGAFSVGQDRATGEEDAQLIVGARQSRPKPSRARTVAWFLVAILRWFPPSKSNWASGCHSRNSYRRISRNHSRAPWDCNTGDISFAPTSQENDNRVIPNNLAGQTRLVTQSTTAWKLLGHAWCKTQMRLEPR